jgi:hypothetical protein
MKIFRGLPLNLTAFYFDRLLTSYVNLLEPPSHINQLLEGEDSTTVRGALYEPATLS